MLIRGARITKRGKDVVSYNAAVGRMAVGAVLGAAALTLIGPTVALADCGVMDVAGANITCNAVSYIGAGEGAVDNPGTERIAYIGSFSNPVEVVVEDLVLGITTSGATSQLGAAVLLSSTGSSEDVLLTLNPGTDITNTGDYGMGAAAVKSGTGATGDVTIVMNGGAIETNGLRAYGLYALQDGAGSGNATVVVNSGSIVASANGQRTDGVRAAVINGNFTGDAVVTLNGDASILATGDFRVYGAYSYIAFTSAAPSIPNGNNIITLNDDASIGVAGRQFTYGVFAGDENRYSSGDSIVSLNDNARITVESTSSVASEVAGVYAVKWERGQTGNLLVTLSDNSSIGTSGVGAFGVFMHWRWVGAISTGSGLTVLRDNARIETEGSGSHGIYINRNAIDGGDLSVDLSGSSSVATMGADSHGVYASELGIRDEGIVSVTVSEDAQINAAADGIRIQPTSDLASVNRVEYQVRVVDRASVIGVTAGIRTLSGTNHTGLIEVGAGATVSGGIFDGQGSATAVINGTVVGAVDMGAGDDTVRMGRFGSVDGTISGGDGNDKLQLHSIFNTNNDLNPDAGKFLNFEIFEFANEALDVVAGQVAQISYNVLIDELNVQSGATTQVSANITSLGAVTIDGQLNVTDDVTIEATTLGGVGSVSVSDLQSLTLNVQADSTFGGTISGNATGALVKSGSGNLSLTGTHDIQGGITIADGALSVQGSLCGDILVEVDGTLKGSGTVCNVTSDGTLAPGNSPGTLTSIADVTLNATSVLELDIDGRTYDAAGGAGSYDRIVLTNATSTFTAGGTLTPILRGITGAANNNFDPVYGDIFTVVTTANANGVVGTFGSVSQPTSGLPTNARVDVLYAGNQIDLVITPDSYEALAAGVADVSNYANFGRALDAIRPQAGANPATAAQEFFTTELYPLSGAQLAAAIVPLSGEIHAFAQGDLQQSAKNLLSNGYLGGLQAQADGKYVWGNISGSRVSFDSDAVASAFDSDLGNLWIGVDLEQSANLRYGIALAHGRSDLDAGIAGSADNDLTMVMGYYARETGGFTLGGKLGLGWGSTDTQRSATLATGAHSATASADTTLALVNLNADYKHKLPNGMDGKVWADLSVMYAEAEAYTEAGSSQIAASVQGENNVSGALTLGYEVTTSMQPEVEASPLALTLGFGLRHEFGADRTNSRSLTMHGAEWTVSGPDVDPTSLFATIDVAYDLGEGKALSASVMGLGNSDYSGLGASLNFVSRF